MGTYGRGFTLNNPANNGFYADANQPIQAGPYTREAGIWGYNEVIDFRHRPHSFYWIKQCNDKMKL